MFNKARTLEVTEFTSASVRSLTKGSRPKEKGGLPVWTAVSVDPIRVADECVKTIHADSLVKPVDKMLAMMEAVASTQRLTASKLDRKSDNLRLRELLVESLEGLRDFSKSTRIGEYGQAICSIFVQDRLFYPIVLDFDVFCQLAGATTLSKKSVRPDFVGWDGVHFCLVESKASLGTNSVKSRIRKGLRQCDAGRKHLVTVGFTPVANYCVLTVFQMDSVTEDSRIKFADPEDTPLVPDWAHRNVSAAYYMNALRAKGWFGLEAEPFHENIYLRQETIEGIGGRTFSLVRDTEVPIWLEELKLTIQQRRMTYSLFIDDRVLGALRVGDGGRYKQEISAFKKAVSRVNESVNLENEPNQKSIVQVFGDGLVMVLRNVERAQFAL